jgi:hypothetical protein
MRKDPGDVRAADANGHYLDQNILGIDGWNWRFIQTDIARSIKLQRSHSILQHFIHPAPAHLLTD